MYVFYVVLTRTGVEGGPKIGAAKREIRVEAKNSEEAREKGIDQYVAEEGVQRANVWVFGMFYGTEV